MIHPKKRARGVGTQVGWLACATHDRCPPSGDKLFTQTSAGAATGRVEFAMPARHGMKGRTVHQLSWPGRVAAPRMNGVTRQIACLRGLIAGQGDGEPGVKAIWLALKDIHVAVKAMRAPRKFGTQPNCV